MAHVVATIAVLAVPSKRLYEVPRSDNLGVVPLLRPHFATSMPLGSLPVPSGKRLLRRWRSDVD